MEWYMLVVCTLLAWMSTSLCVRRIVTPFDGRRPRRKSCPRQHRRNNVTANIANQSVLRENLHRKDAPLHVDVVIGEQAGAEVMQGQPEADEPSTDIWDKVHFEDVDEDNPGEAGDIGVFGKCAEDPALQHLGGDDKILPNMSKMQSMGQQFGMKSSGMFQHFPDVELLHAEQRANLMQALDLSCDNHQADCKLTWSWEQLGHELGADAVQQISTFGTRSYDTIILRRTRARGECINFHRDVSSTLTASVPLNSPEEYVGGRIFFITKDYHLVRPIRSAGSATVHDDSVVHGVTRLIKGVRYGLYLLQKPVR